MIEINKVLRVTPRLLISLYKYGATRWHNAFNHLADTLDAIVVKKDGLDADLDANNFTIKNAKDPIDAQDFVTLSFAESLFLSGNDPANIPITSLNKGTAGNSQFLKINSVGAIIGTKLPIMATRSELLNGRNIADSFGFSIAADGEFIVVGVHNYFYDMNGENEQANAGAAFVYQYNKVTGYYTIIQRLIAFGINGRNVNDNFGISVAISNNVIVIGASSHNYDTLGTNALDFAGAAFVFRYDGISNWTNEQKLIGFGVNGRNSFDSFGENVAISGDVIIIGSKQHSYDAIGNNDLFGAGAVFVFRYDGISNWTNEQKLTGFGANGRNALDQFSNALSINNNIIIIGSMNHSYDSAGNNYLLNAGAAFVFRYDGISNWINEQKLTGFGTNGRTANDYFGKSVSIDNNVIVVGSHQHEYDIVGANALSGAGAVFVFRYDGISNWVNEQKLTGFGTNGREDGAFFGSKVSIYANTIIISAPFYSFDKNGANSLGKAGIVFTFSYNGISNWDDGQRLIGLGFNGRNQNDNFGSSIVITSQLIVIGTDSHDYDENGDNYLSFSGAAWVWNNTNYPFYKQKL